MAFDVAADAYNRFMGRFSEPLADPFAETAGLQSGQRALDVGCGPGALTARLVELLGAEAVAAVDPSDSFVSAARTRCPGVDVRSAAAERLPFADDTFDAALAQLVVHFMADPVAGLREMARVTRPGGVVAACVWDHSGGGGPLAEFWQAVHELDPGERGEVDLPGARQGHLATLFESAGFEGVESLTLAVTVPFATYADWWQPFTLGVGPAGDYVDRLDETRRDLLRERCERRLPAAPFELTASAWCARGRVTSVR